MEKNHNSKENTLNIRPITFKKWGTKKPERNDCFSHICIKEYFNLEENTAFRRNTIIYWKYRTNIHKENNDDNVFNGHKQMIEETKGLMYQKTRCKKMWQIPH